MTTIVLVRKNNEVVVAGDGQVSMGNSVVKSTASKVRKIEKRDVVAGFAGSTADALTLFERLEAKIEKHAGNLSRAAVELAKDWRTDKYLRRLEALMAIGDKENSYIISGNGDVLEPEGDIIGIGSGGNYALAAGKVLINTEMNAEQVAKKAIEVIDPNISIENINSSAKAIKILGRCDLIKEKFLIDVAHNEKAVDNLKKFIEEKKLNKKDISIIFHCSESKDPIKLVGPLRTFISNLNVPKIKNFRLHDEKYLKAKIENQMNIKTKIYDSLESSIEDIRSMNPNCLILIFGSFYLAGEFYKLPLSKNV